MAGMAVEREAGYIVSRERLWQDVCCATWSASCSMLNVSSLVPILGTCTDCSYFFAHCSLVCRLACCMCCAVCHAVL